MLALVMKNEIYMMEVTRLYASRNCNRIAQKCTSTKYESKVFYPLDVIMRLSAMPVDITMSHYLYGSIAGGVTIRAGLASNFLCWPYLCCIECLFTSSHGMHFKRYGVTFLIGSPSYLNNW